MYPLRNFSQFAEIQIMGPNLTKKNVNDKNFGKMNIKFEIRI